MSIGHRAGVRQNISCENKTHKKALIPLPPTGFASFFCANPGVVQMRPQPRRAGRLCGRSAISQNANFGRKMQCGCTAMQSGGHLQVTAPPRFYWPKNEKTARGQAFIIETVRSGRSVSISRKREQIYFQSTRNTQAVHTSGTQSEPGEARTGKRRGGTRQSGGGLGRSPSQPPETTKPPHFCGGFVLYGAGTRSRKSY